MSRKLVFVKFPGPDGGPAFHPCYFMCYRCDSLNCFFPPPAPPPPAPLHPRTQSTPTVLIVILCVISIVLLLISYLTIARYRNFRRRSVAAAVAFREDGTQDGGGGGAFDHHAWYIRTDGFSQSLIDSIAAFEFKPGDGLINGPDSAVCLNEFQEGERLRLLPKCSHAFHISCVDTWLRAHRNCPVCRAPIVVGDTLPAGSSVVEPNSDQDGLETGESEEASGNGPGLGIQGDAPSGSLRMLSDLDDQGMKLDLGLQPVRRSVSMDFSSRRVCNSYGRGSASMKRSSSFTGKRLPMRKNIGRSHDSIEISLGNHSQR